MIVNKEGLVVCQRFSDFQNYLLANREKFVCPDCGSRVFARLFYSFNMDKTGRAELWCTNFDCGFNKVPLIVEAVNSLL